MLITDWLHLRRPIYTFTCGAMVCLLTSSVCHTLGCCAQHISLTVWRFDYVGIAVLIVASFYPPVRSSQVRPQANFVRVQGCCRTTVSGLSQ